MTPNNSEPDSPSLSVNFSRATINSSASSPASESVNYDLNFTDSVAVATVSESNTSSSQIREKMMILMISVMGRKQLFQIYMPIVVTISKVKKINDYVVVFMVVDKIRIRNAFFGSILRSGLISCKTSTQSHTVHN